MISKTLSLSSDSDKIAARGGIAEYVSLYLVNLSF